MKRENLSEAMDMIDEEMLIEAEMTRKKSRAKKRLPRLTVVAACVTLAVTLLCAAGYPTFIDLLWGESSYIVFDDDGNPAWVLTSGFDPAMYRNTYDPDGNRIYVTELTYYVDSAHATGDPEEEIRAYLDLLLSKDFIAYSNGTKVSIAEHNMEIGDMIWLSGPYSQFVMTRIGNYQFDLRDEEGFGFNYIVYPYTGDTRIIGKTGNLSRLSVKPKPKDIYCNSGDKSVSLSAGRLVIIRPNDEKTYHLKAGDKVTISFSIDLNKSSRNALDEKCIPVGYILGGQKYELCELHVDEYDNIIEFTVPDDGEYQFYIWNFITRKKICLKNVIVTVE